MKRSTPMKHRRTTAAEKRAYRDAADAVREPEGYLVCQRCGHGSAGHLEQRMRTAAVAEARILMGIDWMTRDELSQAIPPAYTEWIGRHLMAARRETPA